jgi:hypothetical protein
MDARTQMRENIFIVLTKQISRDNKNQYCNDHAMERASIIENSLYNNCTKLNKPWKELYLEVDVVSLVQAVEEKTTKCTYGKINYAVGGN